MKLAFIAPFEMLNQSSFGTYHLMLPQLIEDMTYTKHFLHMCDHPEKEVILDNGAAESNSVSSDKLCRIALEFGVDEIVAPDVLGDELATFQRFGPFLDKLEAYDELSGPHGPRVGYVIQGKSLNEALWHIDRILNSAMSARIDVWYIPRLLIGKTNDPFIRVKIARALTHQDSRDRPIHFLGMYPSKPEELIWLVSSGVSNLRSLDTSLPYTYAMFGRYIEESDNPHLWRPDDFFEAKISPATRMIGLTNCETLERWVGKK